MAPPKILNKCFTNRKKCDIIALRHKPNMHCATSVRFYNGKNVCSLFV